MIVEGNSMGHAGHDIDGWTADDGTPKTRRS